VNVHRPGGRFRIVFPHAVEQFLAAEGGAAMLDQVSQQLELARGQGERLAIAEYLRLPQVHLDGAEPEEALGRGGLDAGAPQERFDARQKLGEVEGLGHVVVCAEFEANHFIDDQGAGGQHQDGEVDALLPQLAADRAA